MKDLYDETYFGSEEFRGNAHTYGRYVAEGHCHRVHARKRLRIISTLQTTPGSLLDVGCAAGFFLDEARKLDWRCSGVEVSSSMAKQAQCLGISVQSGTFLQQYNSTEKFDVLTMWDYIEHTINPFEELLKASSLLKSGGHLMLSTGDSSSLLARLSGSRWHLFTPKYHFYYFSPSTLSQLLQNAGFQVVSIRYPCGYYSPAYLCHKARIMVDCAVIRMLERACGSPGVSRRVIPFNLWDIMTVIARKL